MLKYKTKANHLISIVVLFILLILLLNVENNVNSESLSTSGSSRAEYYDFVINSTITKQTTDGSKEVFYIVNVINTGSAEDSITIYAKIINVTNCEKPNSTEWKYRLDKTIITLKPAESITVKLSVSSACTCQDGCIVAISVNGISNNDPLVTKNLTTYTKRGPKSFGVLLSIDYDLYTNKLNLDTIIHLDVIVWNLQNEDTIDLKINQAPANWSVGISPNQVYMGPSSSKEVDLSFKIPNGTSKGVYIITLTASSVNDPEIQREDSIEILIKPDLIITDVVFPDERLNAGQKSKISITLTNIGLTINEPLPLVLYDYPEISSDHELGRITIPPIIPNQTETIDLSWTPKQGNYNYSIRIDPEITGDEMNIDNNFRIEPIEVGEALDDDTNEDYFYIVYIVSLLVIIIVIIIFFKISKKKKRNEERKDSSDKMPNVYKKYSKTGTLYRKIK